MSTWTCIVSPQPLIILNHHHYHKIVSIHHNQTLNISNTFARFLCCTFFSSSMFVYSLSLSIRSTSAPASKYKQTNDSPNQTSNTNRYCSRQEIVEYSLPLAFQSHHHPTNRVQTSTTYCEVFFSSFLLE